VEISYRAASAGQTLTLKYLQETVTGNIILGAATLRVKNSPEPLHVSDNGRFLVYSDGEPFFWMGDSAWGIFRNSFFAPTRATIDGVEVAQLLPLEEYFSIRAEQGFNVVQTQLVPLPQSLDGIVEPMDEDRNAHGHLAFEGGNSGDFTRPIVTENSEAESVNDYWDYVDGVIDLAFAHDFHVAIVPAWNNHLDQGNPIFTDSEVAYEYGRWLGERFASRNDGIIWLLGGDGVVNHQVTQLDIDRNYAMAEGITDGVMGVDDFNGDADYDATLMSFHPKGGGQSSADLEDYHNAPWLDFNMIQTSAFIRHDNYDDVAKDFELTPTKPTFDGEASYEYSLSFESYDGDSRVQAWHTRRAAYWAVLAGGFGHTYGHRNLVHFNMGGQVAARGADGAWFDSLDAEGARDMIHLRNLILSRPMLDRSPDQLLIVGDEGSGTIDQVNRVQAARGARGDYAFVYTTNGRSIRANLSRLSSDELRAFWFNPRNGLTYEVSKVEISEGALSAASSETVFDPPGEVGDDADWVLVVDDGAAGFPPPGLLSAVDETPVKMFVEGGELSDTGWLATSEDDLVLFMLPDAFGRGAVEVDVSGFDPLNNCDFAKVDFLALYDRPHGSTNAGSVDETAWAYYRAGTNYFQDGVANLKTAAKGRDMGVGTAAAAVTGSVPEFDPSRAYTFRIEWDEDGIRWLLDDIIVRDISMTELYFKFLFLGRDNTSPAKTCPGMFFSLPRIYLGGSEQEAEIAPSAPFGTL